MVRDADMLHFQTLGVENDFFVIDVQKRSKLFIKTLVHLNELFTS